MTTIRIEIGGRSFDETCQSSEFIVMRDNIGIINYYIEMLDFQGYEYIVYHDGVPFVWNLDGVYDRR